MEAKRLLVLSNSFPDQQNNYIGDIFVKEQLKYIKNYFDEVYVISPVFFGAKYIRHAEQRDYKFDNVHVFFPKYFNFPLFYFFGRRIWVKLAKKAVLKCIRENDLSFDLIHAHYTWPSGAVAVELKKEFRTPVVITEHTSKTLEAAIRKKDSLYIKTWNFSDAIIRVRKSDIPEIAKLGVNADKIFYIPNGADAKIFKPMDQAFCRKKLGIPLDKKVVLYVGNMYSKVKGHEYLIRAIGRIVRKRKDIICIIVGDGPLRKDLENQIKKLNLGDYVKLAGAKPHDEIPLWMNAADLFVLPSLSEGNPTVMFEALACGKPFVGTRVGGVPEIITSEDYGLLCEPANPDDLAEKILIALEKEWDREKIRKYAEQFTWDNIAKKVVEVYKEVLKV